jgi:hypothetical protein
MYEDIAKDGSDVSGDAGFAILCGRVKRVIPPAYTEISADIGTSRMMKVDQQKRLQCYWI